jgi:RimJ/RimL family protein N-acetyltransferase
MFPDITCDDIFRVETARLWLRWLRASDAPALAQIAASAASADRGSFDDASTTAGAERYILRARSATAEGNALILAAIAKNKGRSLVGIVSATAAEGATIELGYLVGAAQAGRGYASEAVAMLAETAFNLTVATALVAAARPDNPASRRVLDKCGFVGGGAAPDGLQPYRLPRAAWVAANEARRAGSQASPAA